MGMPYPQTPGDTREDHAAAVAVTLTVLFERIEHTLLSLAASLARRVAAGSLLPGMVRRQLAQAVHATYAAAQPQVQAAIGQAARDTVAAVRAEVTRGLGAQAAGITAPDLSGLAASISHATQTAAASLGDSLDEVAAAARDATAGGPPPRPPGNIFTAFREPGDAYRRAVERAIGSTRGGLPVSSLSLSRIQAAQKALNDLAEHGITGFTDRAGRNWDLTSYVEMATRTAVSNLWDELQNGAMFRAGHDLAVIGTYSTEGSCPRCLPWLGRTVLLLPASGEYPTVADAKAAGWRHPNCRCYLHPVGAGIMPEVTNPVPMDEAAAVYRASQRQRALERDVRRAGRRYQVAVTPHDRTAARRDLQAARLTSEAHRRAAGLRMTRVGAQRREHPSHAH